MRLLLAVFLIAAVCLLSGCVEKNMATTNEPLDPAIGPQIAREFNTSGYAAIVMPEAITTVTAGVADFIVKARNGNITISGRTKDSETVVKALEIGKLLQDQGVANVQIAVPGLTYKGSFGGQAQLEDGVISRYWTEEVEKSQADNRLNLAKDLFRSKLGDRMTVNIVIGNAWGQSGNGPWMGTLKYQIFTPPIPIKEIAKKRAEYNALFVEKDINIRF